MSSVISTPRIVVSFQKAPRRTSVRNVRGTARGNRFRRFMDMKSARDGSCELEICDSGKFEPRGYPPLEAEPSDVGDHSAVVHTIFESRREESTAGQSGRFRK